MKFRVRIDDKPLLREELTSYLEGKDHVLVHHVLPSGNPHFHFFIDMPLIKSQQSYRYQIKVKFKVSGSDFSVKQCDEDKVEEYIQYLFNEKNGNKPTLVSSSRDVSEHQRKARVVADEFANRQSSKKETISSWGLAMELRKMINQYPDHLREYEVYTQFIHDAIKVHEKHQKSYCEFSLLRVIQTAMGDSKWTGALIEKVHKKIYPQ